MSAVVRSIRKAGLLLDALAPRGAGPLRLHVVDPCDTERARQRAVRLNCHRKFIAFGSLGLPLIAFLIALWWLHLIVAVLIAGALFLALERLYGNIPTMLPVPEYLVRALGWAASSSQEDAAEVHRIVWKLAELDRHAGRVMPALAGSDLDAACERSRAELTERLRQLARLSGDGCKAARLVDEPPTPYGDVSFDGGHGVR